MKRQALALVSLLWLTPTQVQAGTILDYIRNYDLNDYSLGISVSTSQNPYTGTSNSTTAYPYLTSFNHSAFTDDWLLIRGENIGFRYVTRSDWEFGLIGRIQTLGLGGADNDELLGLDERRWAVEAGPLIGWRGGPMHVQFRSYWEVPARHGGATSEIEFSLPREFERGYFVPAVKLTYMTDAYSDYYFGVSAQESTPLRPEYQPGAVTNTWLGFTLGYELSPRWLLSTTVGLELLDSAVTASPIVDRTQLWSASVGLAYNADLFEPTEYTNDQKKRMIELRFGAFNSSTNTTVLRDASDGEPGDEVVLEDILGVADRETILQFDALFRIAYYHRFELGYFETQRLATTTLDRDIEFGDQIFAAGTEAATSVESETVRLGYSYSFMRDRQKELGVTAGLGYLRFETWMRADGTQQFERLQVHAPLPTLGVFGSVALGDKWRLEADINVFALDFDRYDGFMSYLSIGLERKFGDIIGAGIGYNFYAVDLKAKDQDLRGEVSMRHHGPKLYVNMSF